MMDYKSMLKEFDYDAWMLESRARPITKESAVGISPYNTKTKNWVAGMTVIIPMVEVLNNRMPVVVKDDDKEMAEFMSNNYPKEGIEW